MTKHYFKAILISLLAVAAWSQTAVAQTAKPSETPQEYHFCRNGVVEVNSSLSSSYGGATKETDEQWFYKDFQGTGTQFYPQGLLGNTPSYYSLGGVWPISSGEMCDGTDSTVLCNDSCTLNNQWAQDATCRLKTGAEQCGPGVGNGVIQPGITRITKNGKTEEVIFNEQCDDGNVIAGDGCSPQGQIELDEAYTKDICGNGVIDGGDECDDGNIRDGDGCNHLCKIEHGMCNGEDPEKIDLCGNKRVDYAFGEQCDNPDPNSESTDPNKTPDSSKECRATCVLKSSPFFSKDNFAYWDWGTKNPSRIDGEELVYEADRIEITNHGQDISLEKDASSQFSGVFLSSQKIEDLSLTGDKRIFKDGKIHFSMVAKPSSNLGGVRWDDDAFGIVIGMRKGNQVDVAAADKNYKYLMLSWRSYIPPQWRGGTIVPGCSNGNHLYGKPGLRLYEITGAPSYQQLWTMDSKCDTSSDAKGSIKEIKTDNSDHWSWDPDGGKYVPGTNSWNRIINPFIGLNTFYALDFGLGQTGDDQRLQIDLEFSKTELKVWVNKQPAIHITKENLTDIHWPDSGELGFYYLAMDYIKISTAGYYSNVHDGVDPEGKESTVCAGYCGNGIVDDGEACDDGNTNDGDGCASNCKKVEDKTDKCEEVNGKVLCYGGDITGPKNGATVSTKTPTIKGTYVGDPADIVVTVSNASGKKQCEGSVADGTVEKNANGTWSLKGCSLENGEYTTTVDFVPTQSTQGTNYPTLQEQSEFSVDTSKTSLDVDAPAGQTVFASTKVKLPVSGTVENASKVTVKICSTSRPNDCPVQGVEITPTSGKWSGSINTNTANLDKDVDYTITFEAESSNGSDSATETKALKVVDYDLDAPEISNIAESPAPKVIPNPDGTITVEGTEEIPEPCRKAPGGTPADDSFDSSKCPPIYVTIKEKNCNNKEIVTRVNADGTYRADVPLCQKTPGDITLTAQASDETGSTSNVTERTVALQERATPKILISCPKSTSSNDKCLLIDNSEPPVGLVVNGETNIRSERPVVVKAYEKPSDSKCDFGNLGTAVATVNTETTAEGKWAVDFKHVKSGDYCIVAELKTNDGNPTSTTTANKYVRRGALDAPSFVDSAKEITEKLYNAGEGSVDITVEADQNSNIIEGDTCEVTVQGTSTSKTGIYQKDGETFKCTVTFPNAKKIIGKTLVAKSEPISTNPEASSSRDETMQLPTAEIVAGATDGTVNVRISKDFPGAGGGETVQFNDGTTSIPGNSCVLKLDPSNSNYYVCKDEPTLTNGTDKLTEIDANTTVTAFLDGRELEGNVTIDGKPTITITCPVASGGTACVKPGTTNTGYGNIVSGDTSISAVRPVEVKVYKKENGTCDKAKTVLTPKTIDTGTDGVWFYDPDLKGLPPGEYCVVATLDGKNGQEPSVSTTINYTREQLDAPEIADSATKLAEEAIKAKADSTPTIPVTVKASPNSNIAEGDKCVVTVNGNPNWVNTNVEAKFEKNSSDELVCTANVPVTDPGNAGKSIFGKELTAVAKTPIDSPAAGREQTSADSAPTKVPGLPTIDVNPTTGQATITIPNDYPGRAAEGETVVFKDGNNQEVGRCTPLTASGDSLTCTTTVPLTDDGQPDGTKLIDKEETTTVVPYVDNTKVPGISQPVTGTPDNHITCPKGSKSCAGSGRETPVHGTSTANNNTDVTVTLYKKGSGTCETGHGDPVAAQTVQVQNGEWNATFSDLPSGEYCIVSVLDGSAVNPKGRAVTNFEHTQTALGAPTIDESPTDIAKEVIKAGENDKVSIDVEATATSNIKENDKCEVHVDGDPSWKSNEGTFTLDNDKNKLVCTVEIPAKRGSDDSLLGKKLIATATAEGNPNNVSDPSAPVVVVDPGKPTMVANPDGTVTITIPDGYPAPGDGDPIIFKDEQGQEVGRCNLEVVTGGLGCTSTEPLKERDDKLIDKLKGQSTKIVASGNGVDLANGSIDGTKSPKVPDGVEVEIKCTKDCNEDNAELEVLAGNGAKAGQIVPVEAKDSNGKVIGSTECELIEKNGKLFCTVNRDQFTKDGKPVAPDDIESVTSELGGQYNFNAGFVAGGCSTTDSPESGLLALLFAALGFFGIRRRRD